MKSSWCPLVTMKFIHVFFIFLVPSFVTNCNTKSWLLPNKTAPPLPNVLANRTAVFKRDLEQVNQSKFPAVIIDLEEMQRIFNCTPSTYSPETICYNVGHRANFTCRGLNLASPADQLQWYEIMDSTPISVMPPSKSSNYTLSMTFEDFDDKKELHCYVGNDNSKIILINKRETVSTTDDMQTRHFTEKQSVPFNCKKYERYNQIVQMGKIAPGGNVRIYEHSSYTFKTERRKFNGTQLFCLYYEIINDTVIRHVVNKTLFYYQEDEINGDSSAHFELILGISIVVALVILCVVVFIVKRICNKRNRSNNAGALRVIYAELDLNGSNTPLKPKTPNTRREAEPHYAEIIGTIQKVNRQ